MTLAERIFWGRVMFYGLLAVSLFLAVVSWHQDIIIVEQYRNIEWLLRQLGIQKVVW